MSLPDFSHEFADARLGKPGAKLELQYAGGGSPQLVLHLAEHLPLASRREVLEEYMSLATVLHFNAQLDTHATSIEITTGGKAPGPLAMFIVDNLRERRFVSGEEAKGGILAILQHEEQAGSLPLHEVSAPMKSALASAQAAGAALPGVEHAPHEPAHEVAMRPHGGSRGRG